MSWALHHNDSLQTQNHDLVPDQEDALSPVVKAERVEGRSTVKGANSRSVNVMSETDVQAGDAAAPLMRPGESIFAIEEQQDDGSAVVDGPPAKTQAEELASVTPGAAAVRDAS